MEKEMEKIKEQDLKFAELKKLKNKGMSIKDASEKLGVSKSFYYYHSSKQKKKRKEKKLASPVVIPATTNKLVQVSAPPHIRHNTTLLKKDTSNQKLMMVIGFAIKFSRCFDLASLNDDA